MLLGLLSGWLSDRRSFELKKDETISSDGEDAREVAIFM
jgi:hypothetical protein